ncbi:MAG: methylated-DNA--[protein]-cysteine S-methyltransferase [Rhodospirillales bacterium]|nr:methylated-DNA--[protein]-cysteine S-methyltransferase [Rhodospirillales bacterium]
MTEQGDDAALGEQAGRWPMARLIADQRATAGVAGRVFARANNTKARAPLSALVPGTNFQIKVWEALLRTPEGALVSYNQLGAMIGRANSPRAIGNALAANPLAYLIPCHRVIRQTGAVNDYRWGTERKLAILAWEASRTYAENPSTSRME